MGIEENSIRILSFLVDLPNGEGVSGRQLHQETNLSPDDINDAVDILDNNGLVDALRVMGTQPYDFGEVELKARGRYHYEKIKKPTSSLPQPESIAEVVSTATISPAPDPVGSPYGFFEEDWDYISEEKDDSSVLKVCFGFQFESDYYNTEKLSDNIQSYFEKAVETYNNDPLSIQLSLNFVTLGAGYGEHVFNHIAREIISSEIAVFDTSDQNPNVMIEMGVALTWGVRVLPIRNSQTPPPPSDISGQTWVKYKADTNGDEILDDNFEKNINSMVKRCARKKAKKR